jgi:glutathione synthase/RimK-type ligase-like ATP-grasp enzyme
MTILVCTASDHHDPCIGSVVAAVEARGGQAVLFDTDRFPATARLDLRFAERDRATLTVAAQEIDLACISAVWIRRMAAGAGLPRDLDPAYREAACLQADRTFWDLVECLDAFHLDPPECLLRAPGKARQLQMARAVGLSIPRTLISNDARAVRDFASTCPGGLIVKVVDSSALVQQTERGIEPIYARRLTPEDLADPAGLELCPMIFQELVPKSLELRITVVGSRVFVGALEPAPAEEGIVDFRRTLGPERAFRAYADLPEEIQSRLLQLLDLLGLNFATFDVILTPDGRHVFLELNTVSYFDFVERSAGLPISAAIADLLLGRAPPRVARRGSAQKVTS